MPWETCFHGAGCGSSVSSVAVVGPPRGGAPQGLRGRPVGVLGVAAGPPLCWRPLAVRPRVVPWQPTRIRFLGMVPVPPPPRWRPAAAPSATVPLWHLSRCRPLPRSPSSLPLVCLTSRLSGPHLPTPGPASWCVSLSWARCGPAPCPPPLPCPRLSAGVVACGRGVAFCHPPPPAACPSLPALLSSPERESGPG